MISHKTIRGRLWAYTETGMEGFYAYHLSSDGQRGYPPDENYLCNGDYLVLLGSNGEREDETEVIMLGWGTKYRLWRGWPEKLPDRHKKFYGRECLLVRRRQNFFKEFVFGLK